MQKFTQEQIMQYLYGEASPILKLALEKAIKEDRELEKEIKALQHTKKKLDKLANRPVSPDQNSIDAILKYAKESSGKK